MTYTKKQTTETKIGANVHVSDQKIELMRAINVSHQGGKVERVVRDTNI
jgi:hypothetical protein